MVVLDGVFEGNEATSGGAISLAAGAELSLSGTVRLNHAHSTARGVVYGFL